MKAEEQQDRTIPVRSDLKSAATEQTVLPTAARRIAGNRALLIELGLPLIIVLMSAYFAMSQPQFLTVSNFQNVTRQVAVLAMLALGETMTLVSGGLDLSVGSVVGLSGMVAALLSTSMDIALALICGALAGALAGAVNGFVIARLRVPAFIATLGMLSVARGATYILSDGRAITNVPPSYLYLAEAYVGPVPMPAVIAFVLFVAAQILLSSTSFGRKVYAIGTNAVAARLSGIRVARVQFIVYTLSGLFAGIGGVVLSSRTASGQPTAGAGFELQVIAAVVLGGVSLAGGRGKLWRGVLGVLFIGLLGNGLNLLNVSPYTQMMMIGLALVVALALDRALIGKEREPWQ